MAKVQKTPLLKDGSYKVDKVIELAFFDLTGEKAKTKGTSNKSYHAEIQIGTSGSKVQIFSMWGPTGGHQTRDWRYYDSLTDAEKDWNKIIKRKKQKGYQEVEVAIRAHGSDAAKQITKAVTFTNMDTSSGKAKPATSKLARPTQLLVEQLFGATQKFVVTTLKCPLGQLTNAQIDKGRAALDEAKKIVNAGKITKSKTSRIAQLTNNFYTAIPHNLGTGARGRMTQLLLDDLNKIMGKEDDLDTLLDAKSVGAVLSADAAVDAKYKELGAELTWVDPKDPTFKFMNDYFMRSKVSGHGYGSAKLKNLWRMVRKDQQSERFLANSDKIAGECGRHTFEKEARSLNKNSGLWVPNKRPDLDKSQRQLFTRANTWLCWHGTRGANVIGISKKGLLVRPSGAIHTGSMYGDGKYFAWQSTKSLNYTDGGYYTGGQKKHNSRFMFLLDVSFGKMHVASGSHFYQRAPSGCHSVYGKARRSGVWNDEMITYDKDPKNTQSRIVYLFEVTG